VEVNGGLEDAPETVNENPQGDGWMLKVELKDPGALSGLMDQSAYDSMEK
jgi:glycine cleavage system H protein